MIITLQTEFKGNIILNLLTNKWYNCLRINYNSGKYYFTFYTHENKEYNKYLNYTIDDNNNIIIKDHNDIMIILLYISFGVKFGNTDVKSFLPKFFNLPSYIYRSADLNNATFGIVRENGGLKKYEKYNLYLSKRSWNFDNQNLIISLPFEL